MISPLISYRGCPYYCKSPDNLPSGTVGPGFIFKDFTIRSRAFEVFCLENCYLDYDRYGSVVYDKNFNPIKEVSDCFDGYYDEKINSFKKTDLSKRAHLIPGETFSLIPFKAKANFSHFLLEGLPKLAAVNDVINSSEVKLLVDKNFREGFENIGTAISIKTKMVPLYLSGAGVFKFDKLYISSPLKHPLSSGNPKLKSFLNKTFADLEPGFKGLHEKQAQANRVYVHRKQGRRGVENEEDVISVLKKYGFQICTLEDYTLLEQAKLFSGAEIVVGVHGAGLSNIAFSTTGKGAVVEIFPESYATPAFWYLSRIMGMKYFAVISGEPKNNPSLKFDDVFVDCVMLEESILMAVESLRRDC